MAKRFIDTELWQKAWFQDLKMLHKLLVLYLFQNCDNAGVWNINYRLASFVIGETVSESDIEEINKKNLLFEKFQDDKIFIIDFIKFQYGTLSENCKPHKPIIEKLKKYRLYERVLKGYPKGIDTLEEKEQEQDKEKDINLYGLYNNVTLSKNHYKQLESICLDKKLLNELIDSLSEKIETGREEPYKADLPNAHFVRLKAYYDYRRKYPDKFRDTGQQESKVFNEWYEKTKAELAAKGYK